MITTWSVQYLRRAELPDTDTGEKSGVIGYLRGPSVATMRLTQVGKSRSTVFSQKCFVHIGLSTFEQNLRIDICKYPLVLSVFQSMMC